MTASRTVLFVSLPSVVGGSTRSLATVLDGLDGRCRRVLLTPRDSWLAGLARDRELAETSVWLPSRDRARWWRLVAAAQVTARALRHRGSLSAIHANGLAELNLTALAAILTRRPLVVWVHDWQVTPWARRLTPILSRLTRVTFAAVSDTSIAILAQAGVEGPGVAVVPNPIDPADVVAQPSAAAEGGNGELRVGYLGAAKEYKGFHLLPEIARLLADEPVRLLVFSEEEPALRDAWEALRSTTRPVVELRGAVSDVSAAYASCDVVLCPSLEESFGRVAAEAMLNGLPVVASDIDALREVVGDAGLLFAPGDAAGAAAAIVQLAHDPALRRQLGERGRARSMRFSPAAIVDQLATLYGMTASERVR